MREMREKEGVDGRKCLDKEDIHTEPVNPAMNSQNTSRASSDNLCLATAKVGLQSEQTRKSLVLSFGSVAGPTGAVGRGGAHGMAVWVQCRVL